MNNLNESPTLAARLFAGALLLASTAGALAAVRYVDVTSANATSPYTNWTTAATVIQDAVDAAAAGDEIVVTNGTYATGGRTVSATMTNRVAVDKPLTLRSVNGPRFTIIQGRQVPDTRYGDGAIRCVYLANGASLSGFTLTNGHAEQGGGLWCESTNAVVSNCVISGNSAAGGYGVDYVTGGGAYGGTLNNCIVYFNGGNGYSADNTLNYCCTTPMPSNGVGNISSDPQLASAWRRSAGSPCRAAGNAAYASGTDLDGEAWASLPSIGCDEYHTGALTGPLSVVITASRTNVLMGYTVQFTGLIEGRTASTFWDFGDGITVTNQPYGLNAFAPAGPDLDGNPRIRGGTVDIGAYELQSPQSTISYAWLQQFNLSIAPSTDTADADGDHLKNWQEWRCGTDPTNALSALRLLAPVTGGANVMVTWHSVAGIDYFLERATNLAGSPAYAPLATNLAGQPGTTTYRDTNAFGSGPFFYRVGVTIP